MHTPHERVGNKISSHIQETFAFQLTYYGGISGITLFQYGIDKRTSLRDC